jgi:hypothetical protein
VLASSLAVAETCSAAGTVLLGAAGHAFDRQSNVAAALALHVEPLRDRLHVADEQAGFRSDVVHCRPGTADGIDADAGSVRSLAHSFGGAFDAGLDLRDHRRDAVGRLRRAFSEFSHLVGNDRKAASLLTGTGGFDRRVQCQQVGLVGNLANHPDDAGNLTGMFAQPPHRIGGFLHVGRESLHDRGGGGDFRASLIATGSSLLHLALRRIGLCRHHRDAARHLLHRGDHGTDRGILAVRAVSDPGNGLRESHRRSTQRFRRSANLPDRLCQLFAGRVDGTEQFANFIGAAADARLGGEIAAGQIAESSLRFTNALQQRTTKEVVACRSDSAAKQKYGQQYP